MSIATPLSELKDFTVALAKEAGELIVSARQENRVDEQLKDQQELVTNIDIAVDQLIIERIKARFPEHAILSEETYNDKSRAQDLQAPIWIIDPIDGTVNFAHGHFMVAVSIAFACEGEVQVGVVHNPFLSETFVATQDETSTLNGQAIQVSGREDLSQSLIATGFPYNKSTVPDIVQRVEKVLMACRDIRRLGSAAMDICWVACGRLDGYFESLSPWDFAAARLIALQAGARCGHFSPVPEGVPACIYCYDLLITTPAIYDNLDSIVKR